MCRGHFARRAPLRDLLIKKFQCDADSRDFSKNFVESVKEGDTAGQSGECGVCSGAQGTAGQFQNGALRGKSAGGLNDAW